MKKNLLALLILLFIIGCKEKSNEKVDVTKNDNVIKATDTTYTFKAKPKDGFNFDYLVYVPKGTNFDKTNILLVEGTNSGSSDSIQKHEEGALFAASKGSLGNYVSNKLKTPILVPIFPRPKTDWKYYTHAFDSDTFLEKGSEIENLDLQLLAMISDAKKELKEKQIKIADKIFLVGFSASGSFANRFAILHPNVIKAVSAGGINGLLILPIEKLNGTTLNFPIGIANVKEVKGYKIDLNTFKSLPQFYFMGEKDGNDAVEYDDAYDDKERKVIYKELGKQMQPTRWTKTQTIYRDYGIDVIFKTYENLGHETDLQINTDVVEFFKANSEK